jgi:putative membrane protein
MARSRFFLVPLWSRLGVASAVLPLLVACSSGGSSDAVETANAQNQQNINTADVTAKQEADAEFLVKTTGNALLEVELGKLIQARATTAAVKAYGAQVVQNRLELLTALRTLASAKQLAVPPALGQDEQAAYHEVSTQTGTKLDKDAMALLVKAQKQDEDAFDDMKDDAYDGDIRGFAAKYLNPVQEQLEAAEKTADAVEELP